MSWRDVPDMVTAYRYLLVAGWKVFVRKETPDTWLSRFDGQRRSGVDAIFAKRAARWTNTSARYPFPWARCLQRSLALSLWMDDNGLNPVLKFGVRKAVDGIDAHSWVEYQGEILNDSQFVKAEFSAFETRAEPKTDKAIPRVIDRS